KIPQSRMRLRSAFRLLYSNPTLFSSGWEWPSVFLLLNSDDFYIHAYAEKCVSILANLSDLDKSIFVSSKEFRNTTSSSIDTIENSWDAELRASILSNTDVFAYSTVGIPSSISDLCVDLCGVILLKSQNILHGKKFTNVNLERLVMTDTTVLNLKEVAMGLAMGLPILLDGNMGIGKSCLVYEAATVLGCIDEMVTIHLGDQSDSKLLLGSYVCTPTPGIFAWLPGILTQAVTNGHWVLFEDIDLSPPDILSVLIPLLESNSLFIPGRGEKIQAKSGFQIFATRTTKTPMLGESLWRKILVRELQQNEIESIVSSIVSDKNVAHGVVATVDAIREPPTALSHQLAPLSIRDILKLCKRVKTYDLGHSSAEEIMENMYLDCIDCYSTCVKRKEDQSLLRHLMSTAIGVGEHRVAFYNEAYLPVVSRSEKMLKIGRVQITLEKNRDFRDSRKFAMTIQATKLLEKLLMCVKMTENVLLVGETGTGKTSVVQFLAGNNGLKKKLVVINMSQQSESGDLVGGFKPVEAGSVMKRLLVVFEGLIERSFKKEKVSSFVDGIRDAVKRGKTKVVIKGFRAAVEMVERMNTEEGKDPKKIKSNQGNQIRDKKSGGVRSDVWDEWIQFKESVEIFAKQTDRVAKTRDSKDAKNSLFFSFVEGALIRALKNGDWILLDEINLASPETLESLNGLLSSPHGSILLLERGDTTPVPRHPSFRLFAAMNPATDAGKRDLPRSLRARFTEFWVPSPADHPIDLKMIINQYLQNNLPALGSTAAGNEFVDSIAQFWISIKKMDLVDAAANQKISFSVRTLVRALMFATEKSAITTFGLRRAIREGLEMCFCTMLEKSNRIELMSVLDSWIPQDRNTYSKKGLENTHLMIDQYWVEKGPAGGEEQSEYVITASVKGNLKNLARAVMAQQFPVLIQGPTSAGKTSMVEYLARRTGHRFVRINNHEHTDLQEYLGMYAPDKNGKLVFQEGVLVQALRQGHWLVLDELNLAPTDVLEALNRLLDDNRELFIPETQETIRPHPSFMLFATQNPAGTVYGGRKMLSRAFRNRFVELYFDSIPESELESIISTRCKIAPSYAQKMVKVYRSLSSGASQTAGKLRSRIFDSSGSTIQGIVTLRDLFRWAGRNATGYQQLAEDGYMILAERIRRADDKQIVAACIEKELGVRVLEDNIYVAPATYNGNLVWTKHTKRMFTLVQRALSHSEPVLLVGETGTGKTSVVHVLAQMKTAVVRAVNAHQNSETADFLGSQRPVRSKEVVDGRQNIVNEGLELLKICGIDAIEDDDISNFVKMVENLVNEFLDNSLKKTESATEEKGLSKKQKRKMNKRKRTDVVPVEVEIFTVENEMERLKLEEQSATLRKRVERLKRNYSILSKHQIDSESKSSALFEWYDGPLVQAMRNGDFFLLDEISLADDSVLERLNSVLEPKRLLVLAEKGSGGDGETVEEIIANNEFQFIATMNPGGDYGKKELSPALRNRFTEIWIPAVSDRQDLELILSSSLTRSIENEVLLPLAVKIMDFVDWFASQLRRTRDSIISMRDLLAWVEFILLTFKEIGPSAAFVHGGCMVLVDGIGVNPLFGISAAASADSVSGAHHKPHDQPELDLEIEEGPGSMAERMKKLCEKQLILLATGEETTDAFTLKPERIEQTEKSFSVKPFFIEIGPAKPKVSNFAFEAPTVLRNCQRIMRALLLHKPILLEGSPGVGKTSLVSSLADVSGNHLMRINLSEQTDLSDLFGADLPVENGSVAGQFSWKDGPFLSAMKNGDWVLLDELNLASQPVLEGLNAVLDHRAEVYVPELDRTFPCAPGFRVFAAQNPHFQGGGRKGLPKSFANRFTQVFVDPLNRNDLMIIGTSIHSENNSNVNLLNSMRLIFLFIYLYFFQSSTVTSSDYYPIKLESSVMSAMVKFVGSMHVDTMVNRKFGSAGQPWEFNLRDIMRWVQLTNSVKIPDQSISKIINDASIDNDDAKRLLTHYQMRLASEFVDMLFVQRMRTEADRNCVREIFIDIFSEEAIASINRERDFRTEFTDLVNKKWPCTVTPQYIQIAHAILPRGSHSPSFRIDGNAENVQLLTSQLSPLAAVAKCVEMNWLVLLTGPTASGKTSIIRTLATLSGRRLEEFAMNSAVDTIELLGGFEQVDPIRRKRALTEEACWCAEAIIRKLLTTSSLRKTNEEIQKIMRKSASEIFHMRQQWILPAVSNPEKFNLKNISEAVSHLVVTARHWNLSVDEITMSEFCSAPSPEKVLSSIERYRKWVALFSDEETGDAIDGSAAGRFEWVDGMLLRAIEKGDWVVMDNVNLCSASVLDRLNPLFEPNGSLEVTERGITDDPNEKISQNHTKATKPHPNFRMFMVMDPKFGEISRAMRNRAVEIALPGPEWLEMNLTKDFQFSPYSLFPNPIPSDFTRIVNTIGVVGPYFSEFFRTIHLSLLKPNGLRSIIELNDDKKELNTVFKYHSDPRKILLLTELILERCQQGIVLKNSIYDSLHDIYPSSDLESFDEIWSTFVEFPLKSLITPTIFPNLISGKSIEENSLNASLLFNFSSLVYFLFQDPSSIFDIVSFLITTTSKNLENFYEFKKAIPTKRMMIKTAGRILVQIAIQMPWRLNEFIYFIRQLIGKITDNDHESLRQIEIVLKTLELLDQSEFDKNLNQKKMDEYLIMTKGTLGMSNLNFDQQPQISLTSPHFVRSSVILSLDSTFNQLYNSVKKSELLVLVRVLNSSENIILSEIEWLGRSLKLSNLNIIARSFAYHSGKMKESQLIHPVVCWFAPFFISIRESTLEYLKNKNLNLEIPKVFRLLCLSELLWSTLSELTLKIDESIVLIRWIKKTLISLETHEFKRMDTIMNEISESLNLQSIDNISALWKSSTLKAMRLRELAECYNEFRSLDIVLNISKSGDCKDWLWHPAVVINVELRRTINEGVSTLKYLNELDSETISKSEVISAPQLIEEQINEIITQSNKDLYAISVVKPQDEFNESEIKKGPKIHIPLELYEKLNPRFSKISCWPLFDLSLLTQGLNLLCSFVVIIGTGMKGFEVK
ncbi:AAA ATPase midasin, partial [Nowakowskiella sp. JEL0078]